MVVGAKVLISLFVAFSVWAFSEGLNTNSFPDDFLFGVATASYQIEGAWNESGKGENIWDHLTHNYPELILDGSNGDIACDSYHHIDDDVAMLKELNVDFYRFSLSWSRILPNGFPNEVNEDGIAYYNNLINALLANDIEPMVTLYHWDLPTTLQALGGWANPFMKDYFKDYAEVAFENFGDRVKYWITFNEPSSFCPGYGASNSAPAGVYADGIGIYLCAYSMHLSHAAAYHLYNDTYRSSQNGQVGISLITWWHEPNTTDDEAAADRWLQFTSGLYAHPILSEEGDFPSVVKEYVASRSTAEGFPYSRLPEFTQEEIEYIRGTYDFLGLNHYSTYLAAETEPDEIGDPAFESDIGAARWQDGSWETGASSWLKVVPWGFTKTILWTKEQYGNPTIIITENGFSDNGELEDNGRINYYQQYMSAVLDAIDEGANVVGYTAWSLMDNFEWLDGYVNRFGLHYVDMSDPNRPRTAKSSAEYYKKVISTRRVVEAEDSGDSGTLSQTIALCLMLIEIILVLVR